MLDLLSKTRVFLNLIKRRGVKTLFVALDDLWLYNFHKNNYDGTVDIVFKTIKFIEDKQWEIVGLENTKEKIENAIEEVPAYNPYSNPTYLEKERKNNLFVSSTMDFFSFFVPLTVVMVVLLNRLFYCLFKYEISFWFRSYSFWWILFELLVHNNIEFFTFLAFRNFLTPFSFNMTSKMLQVLVILMFFFVSIGTFANYPYYYGYYGKLAKYFLCNMFRFRSSYYLMIITYGARPFLKGVIHALLYEHWVVQMWMLVGVEVFIILLILVF